MADSLYDIECTTIDGDRVMLEKYRGQVLLIVNTASFCGFTPQYKGLEFLYRKYKDRGFIVLGFPCNQFAEEPFEDERISQFCVQNYGVTFPMFAKIKVNSAEAHPLYSFLTPRATGLFGSRAIKWNFTKFLVDRNGNVVDRFAPITFPRRLCSYIEQLLI